MPSKSNRQAMILTQVMLGVSCLLFGGTYEKEDIAKRVWKCPSVWSPSSKSFDKIFSIGSIQLCCAMHKFQSCERKLL